MTWQSLRLLRYARNDILWPPLAKALQMGISILCKQGSIFWIPVFMGIIQRGLHRCRSWESLYGRLALDLPVLVGTGLRAGAWAIDRRGGQSLPEIRSMPITQDTGRYQILRFFAIIFENPYRSATEHREAGSCLANWDKVVVCDRN